MALYFFRILEVLLVGCVTTSVAFFSPIYLAYCKTLPQVLYVRQDEGLSAFFDCHVGSKKQNVLYSHNSG